MLTPVYCNGCGQRLEIPAGYAKSKMRCNECGVFTELPKEIREQGQSARPETRSAPEPPRRRATTPPVRQAQPAPAPPATTTDDEGYAFLEPDVIEEPPASPAIPVATELPEREILIEGTHEDDLNPYTVTGDAPTKRCPECDKKVDARVQICVHCGFNFASGERTKRVFQIVERTWENGWPWDRRLLLFIGLQVMNFITLVAMLIGGHGSVGFSLVLLTVGLQAFLCGTFDKLTLTRTAKGKVTLTTTWRYAFIPRPPQPIKWKQYDAVTIVQSNDFDLVDWAMALILLSYCIVPGLLFWWFVIRPDKYTVFLCRDHGFPETAIFRTSNEERAREIMHAVSDVTTLPIQQ